MLPNDAVGAGINTSHNFGTYNTLNQVPTPLQILSASVNFNTRLNHSSSTYSFPFSSSQNQGYFLKQTGTALASCSYTSGTYINLLTTSSIGIGVWGIDYQVTNTISVGGNITATDTMISSSTGTGTTTFSATGIPAGRDRRPRGRSGCRGIRGCRPS